MTHARLRYRFLLFALVFALTCSLAAQPKVDRSGPPAGVSDALRAAVEDKGYRVVLNDGWTAEFWFAKPLKVEKKDVPGALYPELSDGEFIGVVKFAQGMSDFRGQSLPAGIYTLRYQTLPQDGNHMGVAPNPDFLLASPAEADSRPEQSYPYKKLVALSAKSAGGAHPAVIALTSASEPGTVTKADTGFIVFSAAVPAASGSSVKLGIVIKGAAAQ